MKITVETNISAPIETVWDAYTTPEDIGHSRGGLNGQHIACSVTLRRNSASSITSKSRPYSCNSDCRPVPGTGPICTHRQGRHRTSG